MLEKGICISLITPFLEDLSLDLEGFEKLIRHLDKKDVSSFLIGGSVGEGPLLTNSELKSLIETARKVTKKPLILGVISFNYESIETRLDLDADAVLAVPPIYFKPDEENIFDYFNKIASKKKLIVYNNPGRVGVSISESLYQRLYNEVPNIIGVKECDDKVHRNLSKKMNKWIWFTGNDDLWPNLLEDNFKDGVITTMGNVFADEAIDLYKTGKNKAAWLEKCALFYSKPNPKMFKQELTKLGFIKGFFRAPL